jgi:hypothetical protein
MLLGADKMPAQSSWFCFGCLQNRSNRSFGFCDGHYHGCDVGFESISTYISQNRKKGVLGFDGEYGSRHRVGKQMAC